MTEQLLSQYTRLVDFLGRVLGPDYEIILHEILPEQSRVAAIANGGISGRDVGAPITDAALRMIIQKQYESKKLEADRRHDMDKNIQKEVVEPPSHKWGVYVFTGLFICFILFITWYFRVGYKK